MPLRSDHTHKYVPNFSQKKYVLENWIQNNPSIVS